MKTMEDLQAERDTWLRRRERATYVDSFTRMQAEQAEADRHLARIDADIAELERLQNATE